MPESRVLASEPVLTAADVLVITPVSQRLADLAAKPSAQWTEDDLIFYLREETERLNGPQIPYPHHDLIARDFLARFGERGIAIARAAFEIHLGKWMGAPVTIRRFAESNDEFFSQPILSGLS